MYETPFTIRTLHFQATALSSNGIAAMPVTYGGRLISATIAPLKTNQTAAAGAVDVTVNGSTAAGMGSIAISSGVAGAYAVTAVPSATVNVVPGDVLATVSSSVVATQTTFVIQGA